MQSGIADSLRTKCKIKDVSQTGVIATWNIINCGCEATASQDASNANTTLNTNYNLVFYDKEGNLKEKVGFEQISLSEMHLKKQWTSKITKIQCLKNRNSENL